MTCKDCLSNFVCKYKDTPIPLCDCLYSESDNVEKIGCLFLDKHRTIVLPVKTTKELFKELEKYCFERCVDEL